MLSVFGDLGNVKGTSGTLKIESLGSNETVENENGNYQRKKRNPGTFPGAYASHRPDTVGRSAGTSSPRERGTLENKGPHVPGEICPRKPRLQQNRSSVAPVGEAWRRGT